ncbi:P-loop containing nucleoside triphosphate hydrolase protein [Rickenella mellea]|uniref:P-loop containing nucleoside triphosphate hydrolase protein n=1 Tax=Rickenella mellea TaxID=50990 RepID=A0A4Y7QMF4_9AGAM|nr:P-loop containing nucleoside triphosphate hydrolase protein [Rickenella mellea]
MSILHCDPLENAWLSDCLRSLIIGTALPTFSILLAITNDLLCNFGFPKVLSRTLVAIASPFLNFLHLEDLEEAKTVKPRITSSPWKNHVLLVLPLVESCVHVGGFTYYASIDSHMNGYKEMIVALGWLYAAVKVYWNPRTTPSYLLLMFYIMHLLAGTVELLTDMRQFPGLPLHFFHLLQFSVPLVLAWVIGTYPVKDRLPGPGVATFDDAPSNVASCPEDAATLWQWCTFTFVEPIFALAASHRLNGEDVWALSPFFKHRNLFNKYLQYCERRRSLNYMINSHPSHSLIRFLLASNSLDIIVDISVETYKSIAGYVPVYALQRILVALQDPTPENKLDAHIFGFVTFVAHLTFAQFDLFKGWHTRRCYERIRGQLICLMHFKALKRRDVSGKIKYDQQGEAINADLGKVVNLMQGDAYAVAGRFWQASAIFTAPIKLIVALVFLYRVLGWSSFAGVSVILSAFVINYPLAKYNISVSRSSRKATDRRMDGVSEFFSNIRFLKFYGWENHWASRVRSFRETELKWRVKLNIVDTLISFIWTFIPSATAVASFACYTLIAGQPLTVSKAFTSLALFSQLQEPMTALPDQFFAILTAYVSMQRIEIFLAEDEVDDWASTLKNQAKNAKCDMIGFAKAIFAWGPSSDIRVDEQNFQLGPLDVKFPLGQISLITGATGSGKSALLLALLGELYCVNGDVFLTKADHQVAYCSQNPWLEHATIRDNVIFGSPRGYDEARFSAVIRACALERDLAIFDAGDLTEIGDKGVTLSGGQRARVALARAIYSEANCILLDDPLAAVDMHTAQHLVNACLSGDLVRGRTVILVTHHISLCLPVSAFILEISKGTILRQGSLKDLQASGLLQTVIQTQDDTQEVHEQPVTAPVNVNVDLPVSGASILCGGGRELSDGKLGEAEARAEGRVSLRTYLTYVKAAGWFTWVLTTIFILLIRLISMGNDIFLAKWGEAYELGRPQLHVFAKLYRLNMPLDHLPSPEINPNPWLLIYFGISVAHAFLTMAYLALGYYASLQASRSLFKSLLTRLTRAPSRFFDVTPLGRILNRFTSDINVVDNSLQSSARAALSGWLTFTTSFLFMVWVIPQFAPFALFIAWLYIRLAPLYVRASRDLRRLESVSYSPAFAGFDEVLRGLSHVRAFAMEQRYQDRFYDRVNMFQNFDHVYWLVSGWLRWRYDCLGSVVVYATTLFALWANLSDALAALVIVRAGIFAEASRQLIRVLAQLELDFNSIERVVEYLDVTQEAPPIIDEKRPPAYWPSSDGHLIVEDLVVRYAPDLPAALDHLSFTVKPCEKIGVVGRTGSGKSTLALSLLRIIEPSEGRILLDGIDVTTIGLEDLRTQITIVSQDVSLFSGTIRSNLDPFGEHSDHECWDVLRRCHLTSEQECTRPGHIASLDMPISSTGSLSAGERQLVALARAMLRRTQVIIMDEATSQIDETLDDQIQSTIREELSGSMVITIAHRLKTIIDYDRILVLAPGGKVLEFDSPKILLAKPNGVFREMCKCSADWDVLASTVG